MPFRFKLEPIKRLREHDERRERIRLGREIQRLNQLNGQLTEMDKLLVAAAARFQLADSAATFQSESQFYAKLAADRAAISGLIAQQQGLVEQARKIHQEARMRLRVFERLEERAKERYRKEKLRREQRFLDEIAASGAYSR